MKSINLLAVLLFCASSAFAGTKCGVFSFTQYERFGGFIWEDADGEQQLVSEVMTVPEESTSSRCCEMSNFEDCVVVGEMKKFHSRYF